MPEESENKNTAASIVAPHATPIPPWAIAPFEDFLGHMERLGKFLDLVRNSLIVIDEMQKRVRSSLQESGIQPDAAGEKLIDHTEKLAAEARGEIQSGFSMLHSQAAILLWSGLETLVKDYVVRSLMERPGLILEEPWSSLKVKIGDYEGADQEQKARFLVDEQSARTRTRGGIARFELMVEWVGLKGSVGSDHRAAIYELQQVRNVFAHNRGVADSMFCDACKHLGLQPGQPLTVSQVMFDKYSNASTSYVFELMLRSSEFFGGTIAREALFNAAQKLKLKVTDTTTAARQSD